MGKLKILNPLLFIKKETENADLKPRDTQLIEFLDEKT